MTITMNRPDTAQLTCAASGCTHSITPDLRHVDNLTAGGAWHCANHAA